MEILGIGPFELLLIIIIALIVLGPEEMVKVGSTVGNFIRKVRNSDTWQGFQRMSRALRTLPDDLAKQSGLDELRKEITDSANPDQYLASAKGREVEHDLKAWTQSSTKPVSALDPANGNNRKAESSQQELDQET